MGIDRRIMNLFIYPYIFCIFLVIFILVFYAISNVSSINFNTTYSLKLDNTNYSRYKLNGKYVWPVIGYTTITSYYGRRKSPTKGASSFHKGIDVGAPTGSNLVSIMDGRVIMAQFNASGGFTIIVQNGNMQAIYCHVHNNYLPKVNSRVKEGQVIGKVGPKNVYGVANNPYKDSNGNPTNRINNRSTFTFKHKKRRHSRQSSRLFLKIKYILSIFKI